MCLDNLNSLHNEHAHATMHLISYVAFVNYITSCHVGNKGGEIGDGGGRQVPSKILSGGGTDVLTPPPQILGLVLQCHFFALTKQYSGQHRY